MPGTIKVSVLGFVDFPSSPSTISVTVSLGKKQFQALDMGDFSFSLTSIRDILVIVAGDVEGNEISRADIQAKSIVERGYWDDHFPLEGGGRVHMQLQFLLSQDERNRIRMMRESASRKKQEEYLNMNPKSLGSTAMARSNMASSFYLNLELSDSAKCLLQVGELSSKDIRSLSSPSLTSISLESSEKDSGEEEKGRDFDLNHQTPDRDEDSSSTVLMLPDINVHPSESSHQQDAQTMDYDLLDDKVPLPSITFEENKNLLEPSAAVTLSEMNASLSSNELPEINIQSSDDQVAQKIDTRSLGDEVPVQTISLEENANLSKPSESTVAFAIESSISPNADEERIHEAEKPTPVKKTPSNVRKMISAFEGSQAQDMKSQTKVPLKKSHAIMVSKRKLLTEDQSTILKKEKMNPSSSGSDTKSSVFEEPKYGKEDVKKRDEEINLLQSLERTKLLEDMAKESNGTALEGKLNDQPKEPDSKDQPKESYARDQSSDQPTEVYATDQSKEFNMKKETEPQELIETSKMEAEAATVSESVADYQLGKDQLANAVDNPVKRSTREIPSKNSAEITKQGVSKEEQYFSESSSGWIFPGDAIKLCMTAGGKSLADLVGDVGGSSPIHPGDKKISMEENRGAPGIGVIKGTKTHQQNNESISKGANTSEGPLRQALKIAIMIGFGTLILLTRQGKRRNN